MRAEILYRPSYSMAIVDLAPMEEICVEFGVNGQHDGRHHAQNQG